MFGHWKAAPAEVGSMAYKEPTNGVLANWLGPKQIAVRLGSCEATVTLMLRRGDIPAVRVGRRWRVDPAVFAAWLAGRSPVKAAQPAELKKENEPK